MIADTFDELLAEFWRRHQDLVIRCAEWERLSHGARSKLARDLEALLADSNNFDKLAREANWSDVEKENANLCICAIWHAIGQWYRKRGKLRESLKLLTTALERNPDDSNIFESLIRTMLTDRQFVEAANLVNSVSVDIFTQEEGSNAAQIIEWAMTYDEFAEVIREERLKHCARCVAQNRYNQDVKVTLIYRGEGS